MASVSELKSLTAPPPVGWEAGAKIDGATGFITTPPRATGEIPTEQEWEHVFEKFGVDSDKYMIDGAVRHSAWDVPGHGVQHAYRARVVERPERTFDIEELVASIVNHPTAHREGSSGADLEKREKGEKGEKGERKKSDSRLTGAVWRTLQIGDTHIGKGALAGAGAEQLVKRWQDSVTAALEPALSGAEILSGIHIAFLGDLIEGYVSQDGTLVTENDLWISEQRRVARHLVQWTIERAREACSNVIVSAVPGNHGETTRKFKVPIGDSDDIDIVSSVQMAYDLAGVTDVSFYYPKSNEGHLTYDVGSTIFTVVHGHNFKGKLPGAEKWWSGMSVNGREPGKAHIMLAGHFHSMQIANFTKDKWIMFSPALEKESTWVAEKDGSSSANGILTYLTNNGVPFNISVV